MQATKDFQAVIGRAVIDPMFRMQLAANPVATAQTYGYHLGPGEDKRFANIDVRQLCQDLESALRHQTQKGASW